jgi:hypothetical protein
MKKESTEIYMDSMNIQKLENNVARVQPILQNVVDQISKLGIKTGSINTIQSLLDGLRRPVIESIETFLFDNLFQVPAGFSREKYRALIDFPDHSELIEALKPLSEYQDSPYFRDHVYFNCYQLAENTVEINQAELDRETSKFKEFADSPEQQKRFKEVSSVCDALNSLVEINPDLKPERLIIDGLIRCDIAGKLIPDSLFVKSGSTERTFFVASHPTDDLKSKI